MEGTFLGRDHVDSWRRACAEWPKGHPLEVDETSVLGMPAPRAQTTASFLELSFERARRLRRAVRFGWLILAAEVAVFVPWVWHRAGEDSLLWPWAFLGGMVALAAVSLLLVDAWARREIETLRALRAEIDEK